MADMFKEEDHARGAFNALWRRAPWWRATIVGAIVVTAAATVFWAESQPTWSQTEPTSATARALPRSPHASDSGLQSSVPPSLPVSFVAAPRTAPAIEEEAQTAALCHPHLLNAPASMPQIDVANMTEPGLGHIKVHFWVNGGGTVTREIMTAATFGSAAEQSAEAAYAK